MASHTTAAEQQPATVNPIAVIVCGCLIAMIAFGVRSTMGLFNAPITEANGWGRETFGLAMALQNLVWGAAQPFAGAFADKFGSYRVIIAGAFGTYIDVANAIAVGMLPRLPLDRFEQVGNAAGMGAKLALISKSMRNEAKAMAGRVGYVVLATAPRFMQVFSQSMYLGHDLFG